MILGEEREVREFKKYVGVGEFSVLGFNFDRATIIAKCGYDPGSDQEYCKKALVKVGENTVEVRTTNISVFLKEVGTGVGMRLSFIQKEADDISAKGNTKYVNAKCQNTYVLKEWFTENEYRKAYIGEADFLHFIRNWLSNFKWFEKGQAGARYQLKENTLLFSGNFKTVNDLASRYPKQTVGVLCGIRDTEKGQKQDTCNRAFVPGYMVGKLRQLVTGTDPLSQPYAIKEFIEKVEGEFGYKNFYGNGYMFREYDANTNVVSGSNSAVVNRGNSNVDDLSY